MFKEAIKASDTINFTRLLQLWIFTPSYHETHMDDLIRRENEGGAYAYPMPQHAFLAQSDACLTHDTGDRLKLIKAPTLITVGDEDIFTPVKFSKEISALIPNNKFEIINGGGHTHHWEKLDEFNSKTLKFLLEK